ncbi:hypothetical protein BC628DRAFT_144732 [Trametes gibbosa]|nr:hypothetical protein BC628DRAFT_144732 [Trametes gibbosa]
MRTRRRPVLQDKTPVNTPQKPRQTRAKPLVVPVVEIKARLRRAGKAKQAEEREKGNLDVEDPHGELGVQEDTSRSSERRAGRVEDDHLRQVVPPATQEPPASDPNVPTRRATTVNGGRGKGTTAPRKKRADHKPRTKQDITTQITVENHVADSRKPPSGDTDVHHSPMPLLAAGVVRTEPSTQGGPGSPLRHISNPTSPTAGRQALPKRQRKPLQPTTVPTPAPIRETTPDSIPIADEDSSPSDAVKAIFDTPSPARIVRAPIPAQSTPLGGRLYHMSPLPALPTRGRHESSIKRWNHGVSRAYSPLPPSSLPPPTPPTQQPIAETSRLQLPVQSREIEEDYDMENEPPRAPVYVSREHSSDDPFGLLAAERKVQAIRKQRAKPESSRAPGVVRAPLGTLALDEVPSSDVHIPEHLPTPLPSDDDHNIDDLYLDVDPIRSVPARVGPDEEYGDEEDEDKENVPTADYDLNEDKENLRPPRPYKDSSPQLDLSLDRIEDSNAELSSPDQDGKISIPRLLAASAAKTGLAGLFQPSSSSASPAHALRTPHKHRSAHKRTPLPTPNFSDGGFSDSPLTAKSVGMRDSSPSPVKPSAAIHARSKAGPSGVRRVLAPIEVEGEPEEEEVPEDRAPQKVVAKVGRKRTRAQAVQSEAEDSSDPRAAVRTLESLLPKRSKRRAASGTTRRGRGATVNGKGKGRAAAKESGSETELDSDASPPKAKRAKIMPGSARGRGRGRGASVARGRGRGRGRSTAPVSVSGRPASKRGRSMSKGKGKSKERVEEIDPEEDEERARKRQERIEYFRQLQEYSIEKEDVYVI